MVEYGKKEFGVNLFSKDLFEMDFKENSFDVIHSSNVIEHIFDVKEWLLNINKILKNGGVFVLSTPNYNSFFAKLEKENWRNLSKNHIALFGKKNLKLLLENANFKILKHKTWGSFPKNSKYSKYKFLTDRLAKILNIGDMQLVLAVKG
jgi:2-polyprenyl-3-methyl-5-hydroxy-6-metoxy-1,4-benzoquinol methylase